MKLKKLKINLNQTIQSKQVLKQERILTKPLKYQFEIFKKLIGNH